MKIIYTPLKERLEYERKKYLRRIEVQKTFQENIDLLISNTWLDSQDTEVQCYIDTWMINSLEISVEEVKVEEFIENVLQKFHQKFGYFWKLEITGSENDPVFIFKDKDKISNSIEFRVKEGKFTSCKFEKKTVGFTTPMEAQPIYKIGMICE